MSKLRVRVRACEAGARGLDAGSRMLQGLILLVLSAWLPGWTPVGDEHAKWFQSGALFAALYVVALGTGGIKPNVSAFGADQLDVTDPQARLRMLSPGMG